jgi:hypothetical protein
MITKEHQNGLQEEHYTNSYDNEKSIIFWAEHCNMNPECNFVITSIVRNEQEIWNNSGAEK